MNLKNHFWKQDKKALDEGFVRAEITSKQLFWKRFKKHKLAVIGLFFLAVVLICAIFAPIIAPYAPTEMTNSFAAPPSIEHWLGTDMVGRDMLSRIIYGARVSLIVGIGAMAISTIIGTILGLVSGYFGGWIDHVIMRLTDIFMSFPYIMLILVVASIVGPGLTNIVLILGFLGWPAIARLVRGSVLSIKQSDYIKASIALGYSTNRILFKHVLPNAIAPILVYATSGVAIAILDEAALSFLGLGVQPPTPSWGNMLADAQSLSVLTSMPWIWMPSGIMVLVTVLAINYIGDGLRDAIDPKSNK